MIRVKMVEEFQKSWRLMLVVLLVPLEVQDLEDNPVCQGKLRSSLENTFRCQSLEDASSILVVLLGPRGSCCSQVLH